jgi:hypothetical protein
MYFDFRQMTLYFIYTLLMVNNPPPFLLIADTPNLQYVFIIGTYFLNVKGTAYTMIKIKVISKIALTMLALICTNSVMASDKEITPKVIQAQVFPEIYQAIKEAEKEVTREVSVGMTSMQLRTTQDSQSTSKVFMSDDRKSTILIKQKNGITYGSAIIDGESYSIFNGQITKSQGRIEHPNDAITQPDSKQESESLSEQLRLLDNKRNKRTKRSLKESKKQSVGKAFSAMESNNTDVTIIIDGQELTSSPIVIDKRINELFAQDVFNGEQMQEVLASNVTLQSYSMNNLNAQVPVDNLITTGAVLQTYKEIGEMSFASLDAQIDSSIEMSNVILDNSLLPDMQMSNGGYTLISDKGNWAVGNTVAKRYRSGQERILYLTSDLESKYWNDLDEGICGVAVLSDNVSMVNPDERTVAGSGANAFNTTDFENQNRNIHGKSRLGCLNADVFLHEIGHSSGLRHDRATEGVTPDFGFNYGYRIEGDSEESGKYSIMAYSCLYCELEPLMSSPDRYDFELGVNPYAINGADAVTFLDTSFWLKYMPVGKQSQYIFPTSQVLNESYSRFSDSKTYTWDVDGTSGVQTLVLTEYSPQITGTRYYFFHLPVNTTSITFPTTQHTNFEAYIVSGFTAADAVQPLQRFKFEFTDSSNFEGSTFNGIAESSTFPEKLEKGGEYEISYTISEAELSSLNSNYNNSYYSDWTIEVSNYLADFIFDGAENIITLNSSIESVLATGVVSATIRIPEDISMLHKLNRAYFQDSRPVNFLELQLSVQSLANNGANEAFWNLGQFSLEFELEQFMDTMLINTDKPFFTYRKEDTAAIPVTFTLDASDGDFTYNVIEGYSRGNESVSAIDSIEESMNNDGTMTVTINVNTGLINQPQGDGYFVTLEHANGLPSTSTVLLKDNDNPFFGNTPDAYTAIVADFEFSVLVENLPVNTDYAIDLENVFDEQSIPYLLDIEYTVDEVSETSKQFNISTSLAGGYSENFQVKIYPVDELGEPTGRESTYLSHRHEFLIQYNEPPVLACIIDGEDVVTDVCPLTVYGNGIQSINGFYAYDVNQADILEFQYNVDGLIFDYALDGNRSEFINILFPDEYDTDWLDTSFTVTVSDGEESTTMQVVLTNSDYKENVAPIIACTGSDNCEYAISSTGDTTFTSFEVTDEGEDDELVYTWTATNNPFDVTQEGFYPIISFPAQTDRTWEKFTLTLSVTDGDLSDTKTFTITNPNYTVSNNGGSNSTPNSAASNSDGGGGSMSFGIMLIALVTFISRRNI